MKKLNSKHENINQLLSRSEKSKKFKLIDDSKVNF